MMKYLILLLALFGIAYSQRITPGACPDVQVVQNFQAASYLGDWYETEVIPNLFELGTKCNTAQYTLNDDGSVHVLNKDVSVLTGNTQLIEGSATLLGDGTEGKLNVVFPTNANATAVYNVLGTDYDNYAAVFSCDDLGGLVSAQFGWLLTRTANPSDDVLAAGRGAFASQGVNADAFTKVDHANCPEL